MYPNVACVAHLRICSQIRVIPTEQDYTDLVAFDWSKANSKFNTSTELESQKYFLFEDF